MGFNSGFKGLKVVTYFSVVLEVYWLLDVCTFSILRDVLRPLVSIGLFIYPSLYYISFSPSVTTSFLKMEVACASVTLTPLYFSHARIP